MACELLESGFTFLYVNKSNCLKRVFFSIATNALNCCLFGNGFFFGGGREFSQDAVVTASIFHARLYGLIIFVEVGLHELPLNVYVDL
jgi:hypothetical protein